jgi:hypothetical protein
MHGDGLYPVCFEFNIAVLMLTQKWPLKTHLKNSIALNYTPYDSLFINLFQNRISKKEWGSTAQIATAIGQHLLANSSSFHFLTTA